MTFDADALRRQIPYYLTAEPAQKELVNGLRALSEGTGTGYFCPVDEDQHSHERLQGDGWRGFQAFSFSTGNRIALRGVVLSNSCDISPDNKRPIPHKLIFAPLVKLANIKTRFEDHGFDTQVIQQRLLSIRSQSVTNMFYLPAEAPLDEEYVVLLDDIHSMPIEAHQEAAEKLFTLSMLGFYLFVFKLSVHFCRLHEAVDRSQPTSGA